MPLYTYQVVHEDGSPGDTFTVSRRMSDPPLETHPETGEKVVRVFEAAHIAGWSHERNSKQLTSDKNLEKLGFTKYVRSGHGQYEKRVGTGPEHISSD
jgi:hypothetical protein